MSLPQRHSAPELGLAPVPRVCAVAGVLPEHRHSQGEILDALESFWGGRHYNPNRLRQFFRRVEVGSRSLAVPLERYAELSDFGARNDAYIEEGTRIGAEAICSALKRVGLRPNDVDAVFFTTITGVAAPSLDARIANVIGLRRDVKRVPIFGLGCVGGAAGLARMTEYLRAFPDHVAVLLSVELCSLTMQGEDYSVKNLIATGLFGDGAAAVVAVGSRHDMHADAVGPHVVDTRSCLYPDTEWVMGWEVGPNGFEVILSAKLPALIRGEVRGDVDDFLGQHDLTRGDVDVWVMHPGGPAVLDALQDAMGVGRDAFAVTWESLTTVGNLSSASVLFVLGDTIDAGAAEAGDDGLLFAMGPGFCSEQVLLRW